MILDAEGKMKKIKVFDFFSGCGGTSQGFHQAGMDIVFGLDFDVDAASSFRANFPQAAFINSDIRLIDNNAINKLVKKHRNDYILFQDVRLVNRTLSKTQIRKMMIHD